MTRATGLANHERIFDEASVEELVKAARVRRSLDKKKLREGLIHAAKAYAERQAGAVNTVRRQIEALHSAAGKRQYDNVADLLLKLPPNAWSDMTARALLIVERGGQRTKRITTTPDEVLLKRQSIYGALGQLREQDLLRNPLLGDPNLRDDVCSAIEDLCQHGGELVVDRKRPSGRRSRSWAPLLTAPEIQEHPKIREPELVFVMWLQIAWAEATGTKPPLTAHRNNPGPFARFAQAALGRLGVPHANAVELINDLDRLRKKPVRSQSMKD